MRSASSFVRAALALLPAAMLCVSHDVMAQSATGKSAPSFKDERPLTPSGTPPVLSTEEPDLKSSTPAAPAVAPSTGASFQDTRPLASPSFADERLSKTPDFRDERPMAGASFKDERLVAPAEFNDKRPLASPSFTDARDLQPDAAQQPGSSAPGAESNAVLPTLVAISPSGLKIDGDMPCKATDVTTEPLDGGQMRIRIAAACHPGEAVQLSYGGAEFIRKLNSYGSLDFTLDCFAGSASAAELRFADGTKQTLPVIANDLDKLSKIAVVWRAAANLDLHVFEYGAREEEPGHVWAKAPSSIGSARVQAQADKRGHGLLGAIDDAETLGDKVEVYTFMHNDEQTSGAISMALDYESRGEKPEGATCGGGALAEIDFQVNILPRGGQVSRQTGVLTRVDCGTVISRAARFNQSALPVLRIKK